MRVIKELDRLAKQQPTRDKDGRPLPPGGRTQTAFGVYRTPRYWDGELTMKSVERVRAEMGKKRRKEKKK